MKREQADLLRKAEESLSAAKLMEEQGYHDFAASRAYYTMFYVAEAFLLEKGLAFSKHSAVHAAFGEHFASTGIVSSKFHRHLIQGMEMRHTGDYEYATKVRSEEAVEQIVHAEEFLRLAIQHFGTLPPGQREES